MINYLYAPETTLCLKSECCKSSVVIGAKRGIKKQKGSDGHNYKKKQQMKWTRKDINYTVTPKFMQVFSTEAAALLIAQKLCLPTLNLICNPDT